MAVTRTKFITYRLRHYLVFHCLKHLLNPKTNKNPHHYDRFRFHSLNNDVGEPTIVGPIMGPTGKPQARGVSADSVL